MESIDWIAIGFWIIFIIISLVCSLIFFQKYLKSQERNKNQLALCLLFLCIGIGRLLLIYFDYFLTELNPGDYINHILMWKLANLIQLAGVGFLILISEYAVWKGKDYYVFFIGMTITVTIGMFYPEFSTAENIFTTAMFFAVIIPFCWVYLAIKLPNLRRKILLIFIGFIIYGFGMIMLGLTIVQALSFLMDIHSIYLLSPIIQIPGSIIFAIGLKRMYFSQ
jgi:membrane-associated HD superfamily phosphohydrolase